MEEIYGIYHTTNHSSNGYNKILQQGLKEKHLFSYEHGVFLFTEKIFFGQR